MSSLRPLSDFPTTLEALLERSGALAYAVDSQGRVLHINRVLRGFIDREPAEIPDLATLMRVLYPEPSVRETVQRLHGQLIMGAPKREAEFTLTTRQGDHRRVLWQFLVQDRTLFCVGRDLTQQRNMEQWVRLQSALLEQVDEAIIVADLEGRIIHWTGAATQLFGYTPRSATERPLSNLLVDERAFAVVQEWVQELSSKGQTRWQRALRRESGDSIECSIRGSRYQNERGQMIGMVLLVTPITVQTSSGEVATPDELALEKVIGQTYAAAVVITGPDGIIQVFGRGAERLGGLLANKAQGKKLFDEILPVSGLSWDAAASRLAARGRYQARVIIERPNGTRALADLDLLVVRGADNSIRLVVGVLADRTEIQDLSEEALATKNRALLSMFTEGVARRVQDTLAYFEPDHRIVISQLHDLRMLARLVRQGSTVQEFDTFVRHTRVLDLDKELDDVMYRLGEGVHRLKGLVEDLVRFENTEVDAPGPVRISRELDAARELVGHRFENRIAVDVLLDDLPPGRASRGPLLRGLCLLLLSVAASCEDVDDPKLTIEGKSENGWINLEFYDNGSGYSVDVQSRLHDLSYLATQRGFAPLFLGLAREAIRTAGGTVDLGTAAGVGARIKVSFPAADATISIQPMERLPRAGSVYGHVLLVEEDELLRRALERHIGEQHNVQSFAGLPEAMLEMGRTTFHAAVIAFPRPEGLGLKLLSRFIELAPDLLRNTIIMVPTGIKHATRERLVHQGHLLLSRPVDFTSLRSLLMRIVPETEEEASAMEADE